MAWPRRRSDRPASEAAGPAVSTGVSGAPPSPAGWAGLPPLTGTLDPIEPTVPATAFRDGLAALTPPAPFLAPLGHEVSPDAPAGLVSGLAVPAPVPVQRRTDADLSLAAPPPPPATRRANPWPAPPVENPGPAAPPAISGPEQAPVVGADVVVAAPDRRPLLTSAPPVGTIQRSLRLIDASPAPRPTPEASPLASAAGPAVVQRTATAPREPSAPPVVRDDPSPALPPPADAPVLQLDPLVLQRDAPGPDLGTSGDAPAAPPAAPLPTLQRASVPSASSASSASSVSDVGTASPSGGPSAGSRPGATPSSVDAAPLAVQRRRGLGAPMAERPPIHAPLVADVSAAPVGAGPLPPSPGPQPSAPLPRASLLGSVPGGDAPMESDSNASPPRSVEIGPELPLVTAQRLASPPLAGTGTFPVTGLLPQRTPPPILSPVQRRPIDAPPPAVPVDLRRAEAHGSDRVPPPASSGSRVVPPAAAPPGAVPVPVAVAPRAPASSGRGPSDPSPPMPVQRQAAPTEPAGPLPLLTPPPAFVSPFAGGPAALAAPPAIPTDLSSPPALPVELPAGPAVPAGLPGVDGALAAVASGAAAAAGGAMPAGDLDALAGRLYDKIRYRLKAELRLDRERAGLITDRR